MRYTSAVVLSTLAVGQAAAASIHGRHASFHARRHAEAAKRSADDVNWGKLAYDLKDVDWDKVNWSSVFNEPAAATTTPAPAAAPTTAEEKKPEPTTTQAPPAETKAAEVKVETKQKDTSDSSSSSGDFVTDLLAGVESIAAKIGAKIGKNDKSNNGGIWIGSDSQWKAEFMNDNNQEAVLYCWKANGFSGMSINVNVPDVSVGLKPGEKVMLSFAESVPAACAPVFPGTPLALFGGVKNTWFEVTYGNFGAFDISRNVNMQGNSITAQGSKCVSDMNKCVFKCRDDSVESCEKGSDYDLFDCGSGSGGGGGFDVVMQGTGGGCAMGSSGETIQVTLH